MKRADAPADRLPRLFASIEDRRRESRQTREVSVRENSSDQRACTVAAQTEIGIDGRCLCMWH